MFQPSWAVLKVLVYSWKPQNWSKSVVLTGFANALSFLVIRNPGGSRLDFTWLKGPVRKPWLLLCYFQTSSPIGGECRDDHILWMSQQFASYRLWRHTAVCVIQQWCCFCCSVVKPHKSNQSLLHIPVSSTDPSTGFPIKAGVVGRVHWSALLLLSTPSQWGHPIFVRMPVVLVHWRHVTLLKLA